MKLLGLHVPLTSRTAGAPQRRDGDPSDDRLFTGSRFIFPEGSEGAESVTPEGAMKVSAVYGCVKVIAETLGALPILVYQRREDGGKDRATQHPLFKLLRYRPNPLKMTGQELREVMTAAVLLWGNAYAQIVRNSAHEPIGLYPMHPGRVTPRVEAGAVVYDIRQDSGVIRTLASEEVLHIKGFSTGGLTGQSVISAMRQAISMGMTLENYAANFFEGGAFPAGVLEYEGGLDAAAKENLRTSWERLFGGRNRGKKTAVLEAGVKWKGMGIPQQDAQFLETRRFQVEEIARAFRVPPHMIADLSRSTNNNIEQQSQEFVTYCLTPWLTRWEQSIARDLIDDAERETVFVEFLLDALLRGDTTTRYSAYSVGVQNGFLTRNEVRLRENLNPVDGGNELLVPVNMIPADQLGKLPQPAPTGQKPPPNDQKQPQNDQKELKNAFRGAFRDAWSRIERKEKSALNQAFRKKTGPEFDIWYAEFRSKHAVFAADVLRDLHAAFSALAEAPVPLELDAYLKDIDGEVRHYREMVAAQPGAARDWQVVPLVVNYRAERVMGYDKQLIEYSDDEYGSAA